MFKLVRHGAVAVALSAVVGIPAYSQIIDTAAVEAACVSADAGEADCVAAVEAFIAGLAGVPAAQAMWRWETLRPSWPPLRFRAEAVLA